MWLPGWFCIDRHCLSPINEMWTKNPQTWNIGHCHFCTDNPLKFRKIVHINNENATVDFLSTNDAPRRLQNVTEVKSYMLYQRVCLFFRMTYLLSLKTKL